LSFHCESTVLTEGATTWTGRLKRVFGIDIEIYPVRGGAVWMVACIGDHEAFKKILAHWERESVQEPVQLPPGRTPPQGSLFA